MRKIAVFSFLLMLTISSFCSETTANEHPWPGQFTFTSIYSKTGKTLKHSISVLPVQRVTCGDVKIDIITEIFDCYNEDGKRFDSPLMKISFTTDDENFKWIEGYKLPQPVGKEHAGIRLELDKQKAKKFHQITKIKCNKKVVKAEGNVELPSFVGATSKDGCIKCLTYKLNYNPDDYLKTTITFDIEELEMDKVCNVQLEKEGTNHQL